MKAFVQFLLCALPGVVLLVLWEELVLDDTRLKFLFGAPSLVFQAGIEEFLKSPPDILRHIRVTAFEAIAGLVIGAVIGTTLGLILWADPRIARISKPYIVILGSIPVFGISPMLIIWFGTGVLSKVVMAAFGVIFVTMGQAYEGAQSSALEYTSYAKSLNASKGIIARKIIIPGALRWVTAGLKASVGLALMGAFIGEFVSSDAGLGHFILESGSLYDVPRVLLGILLLSLLALGMTGAIWFFEARYRNFFVR